MTLTFEDFLEKFMSLQVDINRDHGHTPLCHVLHEEVQLGKTYDEELVEEYRKSAHKDPDGDTLDVTEEHAKLHGLLRSISVQTAASGMSNDEMLAAMFLIGRRYGLSEAAEATSSGTVTDEDLRLLLGDA